MDSVSAFLDGLHTTERGLSSEEARRRLARFGANELITSRMSGGFQQLLALFANPLVLILLVASAISVFLGEVVSGSIIIGIVLLGIALNFVQTVRSQRAVERLREAVTPTATVLRDGTWHEIPRREVVSGDLIRIAAGDLVPADARLLEAKDLHVQQSALTGESMPVEKVAVHVPGTPNESSDRTESIYLGTSIVSGIGTAVVVATGRSTEFGEIASRLAMRPPETEFERGTKQFSLFIMKTVVFLVLFVFLVSIVLRRDPLESLLFAVALAVGLTPEFLPMIVAVTLARGAVHMARRHVIVRHLPAIQNFGSMDVLCSDKTGTLTSGDMKLDGQFNPFGQPTEDVFLAAYLNSFHETGIRSPLDSAILDAAQPDVTKYRKLDEIPFDFERRRLSVVVEADGERRLITKGAPEAVFDACSMFVLDGQTSPFDVESRRKCEAHCRSLSAEGRRLLAVAWRIAPDQTTFHANDEEDLTLLGLLAFSDPSREDAADVLVDLRNDGVQVKILTGDNENVARHVAAQVHLDGAEVVLGEQVDRMTDSALGQVAEHTSVFARVSPSQKNRIILALKQRGHVVGFLGDGINDAPSLRAADIGISVSTAVDVARDAAEIILQERSLRVLHTGIIEGRKAFGNVMKYLLMGTSSNFGNMFSMAGASAFLPFLPMLPAQVLLNNFLYDLAQIAIPTDNVDATFIRKPRHWDISLIRDFMLFLGPLSSLFDLVTFWALLRFFRGSEAHFHTGWFIESLATQTLVLFVIRTAGNPLRSPPSMALVLTVLGVVVGGVLLPLTPLADDFGFTRMSPLFFVFVLGVVGAYLLLAEAVKRRLLRAFRE